MIRFALLVSLLVLVGGTRPDDVETLAWMSGCWAFTEGDLIVEEAWLGPRAGLMMGVSRTVRGDRIVATEQIEMANDSAGVVYRAWPSRQAPATFRATAIGPDHVAFENPGHDFPQRIRYRLLEGGAVLHARVESLDGANGFDLPYRRTECAPSH
jgi:hypothetical protein